MRGVSGRDILMCVAFSALSVAIAFLRFPGMPPAAGGGEKFRAEVLEVDNSSVEEIGLLKKGEQRLKVKILGGERGGQIFEAHNFVRAQMDLDKIFSVGDIALVSVPDGFDPTSDTINAQDHYRTSKTFFLLGLFGLLLVWFGGIVGFKALLSFVFSCVVIWKIVVPACLLGANAIAVCLVAVCALSAAIIFLVAGFTRKGFAAFSGTALGVLASCAMAWAFSDWFKVNGAVMPFSQSLLYSGFEYLSLSDLFVGALFLSSSGAVMDLSMDVAAGMEEVRLNNPQIGARALMRAGLSIGRSVVGTMTTTLRLAYSGGYLTLMMAYAANGVGIEDFISSPYVSAEMVKTVVGSFGLVLVAPFTAAAGAFILAGAGRREA